MQSTALESPSIKRPPPHKEKEDTDEEDEAMETEEPTTTTSNTDVEGGSEYCPSSCRESEETSTEASVTTSQDSS